MRLVAAVRTTPVSRNQTSCAMTEFAISFSGHVMLDVDYPWEQNVDLAEASGRDQRVRAAVRSDLDP